VHESVPWGKYDHTHHNNGTCRMKTFSISVGVRNTDLHQSIFMIVK
jgi:hypothetical protein